MLTWLKALLSGALAPTLYAVVFLTFSAALVKRRPEWALYLLAILIPLPVLWYQLHDYPLGNSTIDILVLGTALGILLGPRGSQRAPNAVLLAAFILTSYVALWNSSLRFDLPAPLTRDNPLLADWKNYAEMVFLYFLAYSAIRTEDQQKTIVVIMATVILLIVFREFRNFAERPSFSYEHRAEGPFWIVGLGANHFGAFIVHCSGFLLGLYFLDKHKFRKWLYLGVGLFSIYPLFFSYSRGAYAAALMVLAAYGLLKKRTLLVLVAVLAFTWQEVLPPTVVERIEMTESSTGVIDDSAAARLDLWEHAVQLFEDHKLFGIGFNGFGLTRPKDTLTDTHNFYMKTAAEQGVIGLVFLALVLARALNSGWGLYRRGSSPFHKGLGLGFVGCIVGVIVTNIFGDRWSYFALGGYLWVFWGLVDRAATLAPRQQIGATEPATEVSRVPG